jgi:signal transduction histidine kinase
MSEEMDSTRGSSCAVALIPRGPERFVRTCSPIGRTAADRSAGQTDRRTGTTQLEATAAITQLTLENEGLRTELCERIDELRRCRRRTVEAIHTERRRIERDLHDGTQGRLVSLAMSLSLLEAKLPSEADAVRSIAQGARQAVAAALDELRDLSHGIYPAALAERGLEAALQELAERAALPVSVEVSIDSRPSARVEATTYFAVSEALTNAAKHSHAGEVRISVTYEEPLLIVEVVDDGIGGAANGSGSGLHGLTDRIEALGGRLILTSPLGRGTTIRMEMPHTPREAQSEHLR